jgi:hypothetical protein
MEERIFAIARYAVGSFLILSGIGMLIDPDKAVKVVEYAYMENQDFLPRDAHFQMTGLAIIEIISGLLLIGEKFLYAAIIASVIVLMTFILPLRDAMMGSSAVPTCGCSGFLDFNLPIGWLLLRNAVILITLVWMIFAIQHRRVSYSKGKPRQRTLLEMVFQKKQEQP